MNIEAEASTEMEVVKNKENRWKEVRSKLQPFLDTANLWLAALDGLNINDLDYRMLVLSAIDPDELSKEQKRDAKRLQESVEDELRRRTEDLQPFHWELEFPDVFYGADGQPLAEGERGFDAILGNPPYVSTHMSSAERWRTAVEQRFGYLEDLYIHFTDLGFRLLRLDGMFGFIVSDTFFTLSSKLLMRELLQSNRLTVLGQCDPFEATVDASFFIARKDRMDHDERLIFVQARYAAQNSQPEKELPRLFPRSALYFTDATDPLAVRHGSQGCLRYHEAPIYIYREASRQVFFEPNRFVSALYCQYNADTINLIDEWWEKIADARRFTENLDAIRAYHSTLRPGDITLIGLVAEGAQGMRTGNNARFLGYLAGTPQARSIEARREVWTRAWMSNPRIRSAFAQLLKEAGGDPNRPAENAAAWEACIETLKARFSARELGFNRTDLYRIVSLDQVATPDDFTFTWKQRKAELLGLWQSEPELHDFWEGQSLLPETGRVSRGRHDAQSLTDEDFCLLCQELLTWWERENERRRKARPRRRPISREVLGLRSSEIYEDADDPPRIATIYNGLSGRGQWVPFRKGDPEGSRWVDNEPLFLTGRVARSSGCLQQVQHDGRVIIISSQTDNLECRR